MDPSQRIALHEAAHVVAALKLHRPFWSVSVVANERSAGRVNPGKKAISMDDWLASAEWSDKRADVIVHLAGPHVDYLAGKEWNPAHSDFTRAMRVLLDATKGNEPAATVLFEECYRKASQIITEHWPDVERLAGVLSERKTMTAKQCRQALPHLGYRNRAEQIIDAI